MGGSEPLWVGLSVVLEANEEEGPFAAIGGGLCPFAITHHRKRELYC